MVDVVDSATRSRMMSGIRGANTKPELALRRSLHRAGFRYRLHRLDLPGRPDIVLPRHRAAIFVHGCFWHRHQGCHWCSTPASNEAFWMEKFERNVERDRQHVQDLLSSGWRVGTVWECALRVQPEDTVAALIEWLHAPPGRFETAVVRRRAAQG